MYSMCSSMPPYYKVRCIFKSSLEHLPQHILFKKEIRILATRALYHTKTTTYCAMRRENYDFKAVYE